MRRQEWWIPAWQETLQCLEGLPLEESASHMTAKYKDKHQHKINAHQHL